MKKYTYNIRCKRCKIGFTPEDSKNAAQKMCKKCLKIYEKELKKLKRD